jgi:hypothetical protein
MVPVWCREYYNSCTMPQVMYIPAERNLLSVKEEADRLLGFPEKIIKCGWLLKQIPNIRNEYLFDIVEEPEENIFP